MNHKLYSQSELLNTHFENKQDDILEGLLKVGLYIFAGTSKIGKSLLTTSLANAVANGEPFLSKKTKKGLVLYFDNDNYDFEAKSRIKAQQFQEMTMSSIILMIPVVYMTSKNLSWVFQESMK